jgi:hypothetical protein
MQNVLGAALSLALVALVCVLIASFYFLGRLIRYEYAFHREAWERDGRPTFAFFRPPESTWFRSGIASQWCALSWPLYTPTWVRADPTAKALHSRMRWCVLIWNIGFILVVGAWAYLASMRSI